MIIEWQPILETEWIPPLGSELREHLEGKYGAVRHASCSAWGLLYRILIDNGIEIGEVAFEENGKPYFKSNRVHFSISHSHDLCAVAIFDKVVGIDIEIVKERYNQHLIDRSLCDNEKAIFCGDFTRIWSRKEAVAKMTGKGIAGYPVDIDTTQYQFQEERITLNNHHYWLICVMS